LLFKESLDLYFPGPGTGALTSPRNLKEEHPNAYLSIVLLDLVCAYLEGIDGIVLFPVLVFFFFSVRPFRRPICRKFFVFAMMSVSTVCVCVFLEIKETEFFCGQYTMYTIDIDSVAMTTQTREIVTLQFGNRSNTIGANVWNLRHETPSVSQCVRKTYSIKIVIAKTTFRRFFWYRNRHHNRSTVSRCFQKTSSVDIRFEE
jgi:hypothetical protein